MASISMLLILSQWCETQILNGDFGFGIDEQVVSNHVYVLRFLILGKFQPFSQIEEDHSLIDVT